MSSPDWDLDVIRTGDRTQVDVDLWTEHEGRTDLTLQLELHSAPDGRARCVYQDLHVL